MSAPEESVQFMPGPYVVEADGFTVATAYETGPGPGGSGMPSRICVVDPQLNDPDELRRDATARLLRVAPDMYALLVKTLNLIDRYQSVKCDFIELSDEINAVLAKIRSCS